MSSSSVRNGDLAADVVEMRDDPFAFVAGDQSDFRQHPRMRLRSPNVDSCQPGVEADRLGELFDAGIGLLSESSPPGFSGHFCFPAWINGVCSLLISF